LLIINALLHKIFSALHRMSKESEEQSINFRDDLAENQRGESIGESISENLFALLKEYHQ